MIKTLQTKIIQITGVEWTGENEEEIRDFVGYTAKVRFDQTNGIHLKLWNDLEHQWINCPHGHWVLKGLKGEFYPCEPEVLFMKYEIIE